MPIATWPRSNATGIRDGPRAARNRFECREPRDVVFKRRDKRPIWKAVADFFWPRGGWSRAFQYVRHRVRRLPDPPHRIARGIFAGIFVTFSPFFGLHFFLAAALAWIMRGNIVASLLSTFVGNPLTFVPIAAMSLQTGYFLLGMTGMAEEEMHGSLGGLFVDAGRAMHFLLGQPAERAMHFLLGHAWLARRVVRGCGARPEGQSVVCV